MRVELFSYGRYRYMLCGPGDLSPGERYETELNALKAGAKLFADRNERHWASQPEVVARIRTFLHKSISWHLSGQWEDSPREVVTCLCRCVLDGSVVILRADPAYIAHGGFVPTRRYVDYQDGDLEQRIKAYADRSAAHAADFASYTQAVDELALAKITFTPFRHIETIAEAGARNLAARAASDGLRALASSVGSIVSAVVPSFPSLNVSPEDEGVPDLGDVSKLGAEQTPLGDATPFEYSPSNSGGDLLSMAARGFGESVEANCFSDYETNLDMCNALAGHIGGARAIALCKQNAFAKYQTCRGF
jgi:hypothetical protein